MANFGFSVDTFANWASNNPVPNSGEECVESDTGARKIGDGTTAYNSLAYVPRFDPTLFLDVGFSAGNSQTIPSGSFTTITNGSAGWTKNSDANNNFNASTGLYKVPKACTLLIVASLRLADNSTANLNYFTSVHTSNADNPTGVWSTFVGTAANNSRRQTTQVNRIGSFAKNDQLRLLAYCDGASAVVTGGSINILGLS